MADLKDLKQAILEIPKLVESLKKQKLPPEKIQMTEVKPNEEKIPVRESNVPKMPDSSIEFKTLKETLEQKLALQKEQLEKELNVLRESFNTQVAVLKASAESQNKTLKEMFDLINRIANAPSIPSDFKKKDGEPAQKPKNVFEEAKALSQKVFSN